MTRVALVALLCLTACKTSFEAESASRATLAETLDADRQVDKHVVDAPDKTTTTIEEFATGEAQLTQGRDPAGKEGSGPRTAAPSAQFLVKRTVIVAEHGAVVTDLHVDAKSQERQDSEVTATAHEKRAFDFLHSPFALLGGIVALAGLAYLAWRIFKPRLLP